MLGRLATLACAAILLSSIIVPQLPVSAYHNASHYYKVTCSDETNVPPAFGEKKLALIIVDFPDRRHELPNDDYEGFIQRIKQFYELSSYGQMRWDIAFSGKVYTLSGNIWSYTTNGSNSGGPQNEAIQTASNDYGGYERFDVVTVMHTKGDELDRNLVGGVGSMGRIIELQERGGQQHSRVSFGYDSSVHSSFGTFVHEVGHNMGFQHYYGHEFDETYPGRLMDPMGFIDGDFSSYSKLRLGWLTDANVKTVEVGEKATVRIDALGLKPAGISVVKLPLTDRHYYLIEVREPVGADNVAWSNFGYPEIYEGVYVLDAFDANFDSSVKAIDYLLNEDPSFGSTIPEMPLRAGQSLMYPPLGEINVLSKNGNSYEIEIDRTSVNITEAILMVNRPPVAESGSGPRYIHGNTVFLGSGSYDPDCDELSYQWKSLNPTQVAVHDSDSESTDASISGYVPSASFELIVSDGYAQSEPIIIEFVRYEEEASPQQVVQQGDGGTEGTDIPLTDLAVSYPGQFFGGVAALGVLAAGVAATVILFRRARKAKGK